MLCGSGRLGWQTSFVEDPLLQAGKAAKGISSKIRQEAVAEARAQAAKAAKEGEEAEAVRELIGPRGGLPTLKADLQNKKTTVEQLKAGIKPVVQILLNKAPESGMTSTGDGSSSQKELPKPTQSLEAQPGPQRTIPPTSSTAIASSSSGVKMQDVQELLAQQDQKFQTMLNQGMSHMMSMQGNQMPVGLQTQGAMRYDMATSDAPMESSDHEWTPQEKEEAQDVWDTEEMSPRRNQTEPEEFAERPLFRSGLNPWTAHQELKPGLAQMIGQAWEKHCRDRKMISKNPREVLQVMHQEWDQQMSNCFSENFVMRLEIRPQRGSRRCQTVGAVAQVPQL